MGQAISRAPQAEETGLEKPLAVSAITKTSSISWATCPLPVSFLCSAWTAQLLI